MRLEGINIGFLEEPNNDSGWIPTKLLRLIKEGVLFDSVHLGKIMRENVGDITFLEAFQKTRRILNITVSSPTVYEVPRLLNYLTAPHVLVWSAAEASCAVPGVFGSRKIMAKDPKTQAIIQWKLSDIDETRWVDGSLENDIPLRRLAELFNVNHFIVSQVNPHVYPFMRTDPRITLLGSLFEKALIFLGSEIKFRLTQFSRWGIFPQLCHRVLAIMNQPYVGDITIVPNLTFQDVANIFAPSTPRSVKTAIDKGERATWPYISMVYNRCAVELALEQILYDLRVKLVEDSALCRQADEKFVIQTSPSTRSLTLDAFDRLSSSEDAVSGDSTPLVASELGSADMHPQEAPVAIPNSQSQETQAVINNPPVADGKKKARNRKKASGNRGHAPSRRHSIGLK